MGYQVEYETSRIISRQKKRPFRHIPAMTAGFFLLFVLLVHGFWPRGREVLQKIIFPGDAAVTTAALEELTQELQMGAPLGEAVEGFCREVIADAGLVQD